MSDTQRSSTQLRTDDRVLNDSVLQRKDVELTGTEQMVLPSSDGTVELLTVQV